MTGIQSLLVGPGALLSSSGSAAAASGDGNGGTTGNTNGVSGSSSTGGGGATTTSLVPGVPTVEQVKQAALKAVNECPPHVHLSSRDAAPQLKIEDGPMHRRLVLRGGMRGYRMARATHGVECGIYYYECLILRPPLARDVVGVLPVNVRLGKGLQKSMQEQLIREEFEERQKRRMQQQQQGSADPSLDETTINTTTKLKKRKLQTQNDISNNTAQMNMYSNIASTGPYANELDTINLTLPGHVRIGYSMRTGDLQAPVGYDRWSYGLRDMQGSKIHNSKREDRWGGESFGPGDVVGFAICLTGKDNGNGAGVVGSNGDGTATAGGTSK
eukprot:1262439-Ditylum_brightwellii.AAC.1